MRIELERLRELGGRFSQVYEVEDLSLDDDVRLTEPTEVRGLIRRAGNEIELRGQLEARIQTVCGRCLKSVVLPVSSEFLERFVPAVSWLTEEQHELSEEELNLAVFDGEAIDLDDLVREEILLAMPARALCNEECKGLCPVCGANRNTDSCNCDSREIDPRWEELKNLRF